MPPDVVVVGSINQDLTVLTPRHPEPGETVLGTGHHSGAGGKGANQAVAAARLGAEVAMVGRVGNDSSGHRLRQMLEDEGIDVSEVGGDAEAPTGLAVIVVDEEAENSIVVSPGANMRLSPADVQQADRLLATAKVVLVQLEIPMATVLAVAAATEGVLCLNPAPAQPLPAALTEVVDVLIPNRSELAVLTGAAQPETIDEVSRAARSISGPETKIVTLGSEGSVVVRGGSVEHIGAPRVEAVDTTGAGDAFCGVLAAVLSQGRSVTEAARWASVAGALATTQRGAQTALPTAAEVEALLDG